MSSKALRKYLARHAEPEARAMPAWLARGRPYGHVLCIPACGEGEGLLQTLESIPQGPLGAVLVILVVNESQATPDWLREGNRRSLAALRGERRAAAEGQGPFARLRHPRGELLLIDRTQSGRVLPARQGVGLARKIAADVALAVWARGSVESPWIHCSDADVLFPEDYFGQPAARRIAPGEPPPAALLYAFRHLTERDPALARAALRYEAFLRYHVLGLHAAGSRYAFHSIGSTLAIAPLAYAQARGFPRRAAAEDFHLLAKLAKLGPIRPLRGAPLLLSGRVSSRAPFGTGPAIARALTRAEAGGFFPAHDPRVFAWLGVWLRTLDAFTRMPQPLLVGLRERLCEFAVASEGVDAICLYETLDALGAIRAAEQGQARGARHLHERFDALRTLRFLHALRDRRFPAIPLATAIREAPFLDLEESALERDPAALCEALAKREALLRGSGVPEH